MHLCACGLLVGLSETLIKSIQPEIVLILTNFKIVSYNSSDENRSGRGQSGDLALLIVTSQTPENISTMARALSGVNTSRPRHTPVIVATMGCT